MVIGVAVLAVAIAALVVKRIVDARIAAAAEVRALRVAYASTSVGVARVELSEVIIRPKSSDRVNVTAGQVTVRLASLKPYFAEVPRAVVAVSGNFTEIIDALSEVRRADERLPLSERLPFDVQSGSFHWAVPFGEKSSVYFSGLKASARPQEGKLYALLSGGKIAAPRFSLSPVEVVLDRQRLGGEVHAACEISPEGAGLLTINAGRSGDGDAFSVKLHRFALRALHLEGAPLDLAHTTIDGDASVDRTPEGAAKSSGKLTVEKLALPPVSVGPIRASFGGDAHVAWKASPKKGAPGVMVIDEGRADLVIRGKTRPLTFTGVVSIGEDGNGPFVVDLHYDLAAIPCSEIAASVGGFAGQLVASSVKGSIAVSGTVKADLAALDLAKVSSNVRQDCALEVGLPGFSLP
ncbi:MAG: hypothetical protein NVSMB1_21920 [Polyangiales bacterium]